MIAPIQIKLLNDDIREIDGDIIALKFTKDNYGLSQELLYNNKEIEEWLFKSKEFEVGLFEIKKIKAEKVLFVHLPLNANLSYKDITDFFLLSLKYLVDQNIDVKTIVTTIQGADFLDEQYSLQCQIAGIVEAMKKHCIPKSLKEIIIAENEIERFKRLLEYLKILIDPCRDFLSQKSYNVFELHKVPYDFRFPKQKEKHIFVAMPFGDEFDDIFYYGIDESIRENGYLSLRIDKTKFIGDIVQEMIDKIESAEAVIADLSNSNPNVYLELGYAWGKGKRNILIAKNINELKFDVKGRRCLEYKNIRELQKMLTEEINQLIRNGAKNHV